MSAAPDVAWLVLRAQSGDRNALEQLLRHAQGLLRPYVLAMMGDADRTADAMQEALITIYRKLKTLQEPRAFNAWARRLTSRIVFHALDRARRHEARHLELPEDVPFDDSPARESENLDLVHAVPDLLQRVSPASREVLILHYLQEMSIDEIATVLDIPTGTVKSRLGYGLRSRRRALEGARPA